MAFKTLYVGLFITIFMISSTSFCQDGAEMPNCALEETAQFDFWVGDWDLTWPDSGVGTNHVTKALDGCIIVEHFDGTPSISMKGMSVSVYDKINEQWRQTWVDNNGAYLDFTGGMVDDTMILSRNAVREGKEIQQRMVFYNITQNEFDWDWMLSTDDGETWQSKWQIHYKRKK